MLHELPARTFLVQRLEQFKPDKCIVIAQFINTMACAARAATLRSEYARLVCYAESAGGVSLS